MLPDLSGMGYETVALDLADTVMHIHTDYCAVRNADASFMIRL